jgi:hypothetical protein
MAPAAKLQLQPKPKWGPKLVAGSSSSSSGIRSSSSYTYWVKQCSLAAASKNKFALCWAISQRDHFAPAHYAARLKELRKFWLRRKIRCKLWKGALSVVMLKGCAAHFASSVNAG